MIAFFPNEKRSFLEKLCLNNESEALLTIDPQISPFAADPPYKLLIFIKISIDRSIWNLSWVKISIWIDSGSSNLHGLPLLTHSAVLDLQNQSPTKDQCWLNRTTSGIHWLPIIWLMCTYERNRLEVVLWRDIALRNHCAWHEGRADRKTVETQLWSIISLEWEIIVQTFLHIDIYNDHEKCFDKNNLSKTEAIVFYNGT